jgi:hypothetical protein
MDAAEIGVQVHKSGIEAVKTWKMGPLRYISLVGEIHLRGPKIRGA